VKWTSWVSLVGLTAIVGIVVYSSFQVGGVRCEVCMRYDGRDSCRAVDGTTESETRQAAITNACALVASGVTATLACEHSTPVRESCSPR
jgi:hypothetical protein